MKLDYLKKAVLGITYFFSVFWRILLETKDQWKDRKRGQSEKQIKNSLQGIKIRLTH